MKAKKDKIAKLISRLGAASLLRDARGLLYRDLRIIAYHRVCDVDDSNDQELVSASLDDFDWQVAYLKRHYYTLTFDDLARAMQNGDRLPHNPVIITFDDGFRDNYENAFAVLKDHGVAATFYLSTGYIDGDETFWFNLVAKIVNGNPGKRLELPVGDFTIGDEAPARRQMIVDLLTRLKQVPDAERLQTIDAMKQQLSYADDDLCRPMTWAQVCEMSEAGMEIGSHSVSHPILTRIDAKQLRDEIFESKREIEGRIGKPVVSISYPEGMGYAFDANVLNNVDEAGYVYGATYIPGTNREFGPGSFKLRRGHVERYTTRERFAAMLACPEVFN